MGRMSQKDQKEKLQMDIILCEAQIKELEDLVSELEMTIKKHEGETTQAETDPALAGAKKAYKWVYDRTGDTTAAAKAFNSYLLGGQYTQGNTYTGDCRQIDADEEIKACKQRAVKIAQIELDRRRAEGLM